MQHKSTHWLITSQKYNNSQAHQFINFQTIKLINLSIQKIQTHQPINIQSLKIVTFILQYRSNFHFVLAKILAEK